MFRRKADLSLARAREQMWKRRSQMLLSLLADTTEYKGMDPEVLLHGVDELLLGMD